MSVYVIAAGADAQKVKIGWSVQPEQRLAQLQTATAQRLSIVRTIEAERKYERVLHHAFWPRKISGEWFKNKDGKIVRAIDWAEDFKRSAQDDVPKAINRAMRFVDNDPEELAMEFLISEVTGQERDNELIPCVAIAIARPIMRLAIYGPELPKNIQRIVHKLRGYTFGGVGISPTKSAEDLIDNPKQLDSARKFAREAGERKLKHADLLDELYAEVTKS